jgi:hypothetical protein
VVSRAQDGSGAAGLTDGELDRLADYLADALDPDDAAEVDRRLAGDHRWSAARAALVEADAAVRDLLAGPVAAAGPMPTEIAARLDETLRGLSGLPAAASTATEPKPNVSSLATARAKRRRFITAIATVAAGAVAVVGGLNVATAMTENTVQSTAVGGANGSPLGGEAAAASGVPPALMMDAPVYFASGTNYTSATLGRLSAPLAAAVSEVPPQNLTKDAIRSVPQVVRDRVPNALARLLDQAELSTCLRAVLATYAGSVTALDYASFAGDPALIVLVRQGKISTVVAVGPNCGRAGADQMGAAQAS